MSDSIVLTGDLKLIREGNALTPAIVIDGKTLSTELEKVYDAHYDENGVINLGEAIVIIEVVESRIAERAKESYA